MDIFLRKLANKGVKGWTQCVFMLFIIDDYKSNNNGKKTKPWNGLIVSLGFRLTNAAHSLWPYQWAPKPSESVFVCGCVLERENSNSVHEMFMEMVLSHCSFVDTILENFDLVYFVWTLTRIANICFSEKYFHLWFAMRAEINGRSSVSMVYYENCSVKWYELWVCMCVHSDCKQTFTQTQQIVDVAKA